MWNGEWHGSLPAAAPSWKPLLELGIFNGVPQQVSAGLLALRTDP